MQQRRARQRQDVVGDLLRAPDRLDERADLVRHAGALGLERAVRQELPCMAFHTPHGSHRFRLPWSWSSFDYRELCLALWEQCGDARFEITTVTGRSGRIVASP